MKVFTIIYIILYILHIFLGPYFIWYLLSGQIPEWRSKSITQVFKRSIYSTYVSLLFIAYYIEYPNIEHFVCATTVSIIATITYIYKYYDSSYIQYGITDHFLFLLLPLFYFSRTVTFKTYPFTTISYITMLYIITIPLYDQFLYIGGKDL